MCVHTQQTRYIDFKLNLHGQTNGATSQKYVLSPPPPQKKQWSDIVTDQTLCLDIGTHRGMRSTIDKTGNVRDRSGDRKMPNVLISPAVLMCAVDAGSPRKNVFKYAAQIEQIPAMLAQYWTKAIDVGAILKQRCPVCFNNGQEAPSQTFLVSKHKTSIQCWFNVGPASLTLA